MKSISAISLGESKMTTLQQQAQFDSIGNQLDLVNLLTIVLNRAEIKGAFELISPSMLGVIKNLCVLEIRNQGAIT